MAVLLLQLVGPMQSWGFASRFDNRDTGREPTKSGVIGILAAALGLPRTGDISSLAGLRMSVRIDSEGLVARDYQTVGGGRVNGREYGVPKAGGGNFGTVVSERFYLSDAAFLVALEGDEMLLRKVDNALNLPHWFLALGRRSYPPALPIRIPGGLYGDRSVEELFRSYPRLKANGETRGGQKLRMVHELRTGEAPEPHELRRSVPDQPLSFMPPRHTLRDVAVGFVELEVDSREAS